MKKLGMLALVVALLLVALAGCGGSKPAANAAAGSTGSKATPAAEKSTGETGSASTDDQATEEPNPTPEAGEANTEVAPTVAAADDTLSLNSRDAGLNKLKSYRMRWLSDWNSTESGKTDKASWNWTEEYSSDPQALHWIWEVADSTGDNKGTNMEMWQIGNTSYLVMKDAQGQGSCMSFSSEDEKSQFTKGLFSPNSLGSVSDARLVGTETVNDIPAKHYKYDQAGATLAGMGKINGEIWVAVDGGYVVKDTMAWEGAAGIFGSSKSDKGNGKWTWELSDVDKPIDIKAPENCGGAAKDVPVMPDATKKGTMGDIITYESASKIADVAAFYQKEMPAAGWQAAEGEAQVSEELAMLSFTKGEQKAQVMISTSDGKTSVMVSISK